MTFTLSKRDLWMLLNTLLLITVLGLVLWLQPWSNGNDTQKRTITVSGQGSVEAEADEFIFSPSYDIKADSKEDVISIATTKANEVVDGLKNLGLEDKDINLDTSSYQNWYFDEENSYRSYVYITITTNKDKSQEVQDYLLTTAPSGQYTPQPSFSKDKQKQLSDEARTKAITDAKEKAEKNASELGLKVKEVVSVNESENSPYGPFPYAYSTDLAVSSEEVGSIPVLTGEQEVTIRVDVVFEIN